MKDVKKVKIYHFINKSDRAFGKINWYFFFYFYMYVFLKFVLLPVGIHLLIHSILMRFFSLEMGLIQLTASDKVNKDF